MNMDVRIEGNGLGYRYIVDLPLVGGPRHGDTQPFHLTSLPSAAALTCEMRMPETQPDGSTRWDLYALQRDAQHRPVCWAHDESFVYRPKPVEAGQ